MGCKHGKKKPPELYSEGKASILCIDDWDWIT